MNDLWVCGKYISKREDGAVWEFVGVFSEQRLAEAACLDTTYFIAPVCLDQVAPRERTPWPGVRYPKWEGK